MKPDEPACLQCGASLARYGSPASGDFCVSCDEARKKLQKLMEEKFPPKNPG